MSYQFPDQSAEGGGDDWDANWLQISGDVVDGELAWHFEDPCLTTREARELLGWLRRVAAGDLSTDDQTGDGRMWFTEPNVHFAVRDRDGDTATVVVSFAQESPPPGAADEMRYGDGHGILLHLSALDIKRAADAWERELKPFPER
ncbi:MAG TPA: hypothetical protein VFL65_04050 [Jatrophihabitans sp.]|nr:hypothetical protein [Jatrophihabitans sp.]